MAMGGPPGAKDYVAEELIRAVKIVAHALNAATLDDLVRAHAYIGDYLMAIIDGTPDGDFSNASAQRVLGTLWAELEEAIDLRRAAQVRELVEKRAAIKGTDKPKKT